MGNIQKLPKFLNITSSGYFSRGQLPFYNDIYYKKCNYSGRINITNFS
jgi:hypothetical protein